MLACSSIGCSQSPCCNSCSGNSNITAPLLSTVAKLRIRLQALANGDLETLASVVDSACAAITQRIAGVATESAASINQATVQLQMLQLLGEACTCPSTPLLDPPSGAGISHCRARWWLSAEYAIVLGIL